MPGPCPEAWGNRTRWELCPEAWGSRSGWGSGHTLHDVVVPAVGELAVLTTHVQAAQVHLVWLAVLELDEPAQARQELRVPVGAMLIGQDGELTVALWGERRGKVASLPGRAPPRRGWGCPVGSAGSPTLIPEADGTIHSSSHPGQTPGVILDPPSSLSPVYAWPAKSGSSTLKAQPGPWLLSSLPPGAYRAPTETVTTHLHEPHSRRHSLRLG